jgi:hypothetical protein
MEPMFHYCIHRSPISVPILSQMNSVHVLQYSFINIQFSTKLPLKSKSFRRFFIHSFFSTKSLHIFRFSPKVSSMSNWNDPPWYGCSVFGRGINSWVPHLSILSSLQLHRPFWSNYSPQQLVLEYPQPRYSSYCEEIWQGKGQYFFLLKNNFTYKIWKSRYLYLEICTPFWIRASLHNVAIN